MLLRAVTYDRPTAGFVRLKPPPPCRPAVLTKKSGWHETNSRNDDDCVDGVIVFGDRENFTVVFKQLWHCHRLMYPANLQTRPWHGRNISGRSQEQQRQSVIMQLSKFFGFF
jgi:hypothetical protein